MAHSSRLMALRNAQQARLTSAGQRKVIERLVTRDADVAPWRSGRTLQQ